MSDAAPHVVITGAQGFVGRNLASVLGRRTDIRLTGVDIDDGPAAFADAVTGADVVFHLAGVNRPPDPSEYEAGNAGVTRDLAGCVRRGGRRPLVVMSSSIQAELDNPYGLSKLHAEQELERLAADGAADVVIVRLHNLFGKWCRPNYNSVVATFCHNIARGHAVLISDRDRMLDLVYIDQVVERFAALATGDRSAGVVHEQIPIIGSISLGDLAELITSFRESRRTLVLPELSDPFVRALYATYLSYLPDGEYSYSLEQRTDPRGTLAEFVKSPHCGQIFVSRTNPGITRGNHYHHTKVEKFLVLEGDAVVRFRSILGGDVTEYPVAGKEFRVIDIPPGLTHSIENVGTSELVVLFWASEPFDPARPDTQFLEVMSDAP